MAKKEKDEAPAYLDYSGTDTSNSSDTWKTTQWKSYWDKLLVKHHRLAGHPFSIAETTNLSRLIKHFDREELKDMMEYWISKNRIETANNFMWFYSNRVKVFAKVKPKNYSDYEQ